jgi:hypothetical protein
MEELPFLAYAPLLLALRSILRLNVSLRFDAGKMVRVRLPIGAPSHSPFHDLTRGERVECPPRSPEGVEVHPTVDPGPPPAAVVLPDEPPIGAKPRRQHDAAGPERLACEVAT